MSTVIDGVGITIIDGLGLRPRPRGFLRHGSGARWCTVWMGQSSSAVVETAVCLDRFPFPVPALPIDWETGNTGEDTNSGRVFTTVIEGLPFKLVDGIPGTRCTR